MLILKNRWKTNSFVNISREIKMASHDLTVGDLIELLQDYDPDTIVVMASDPEGNGYAPLCKVDAGFFNSKDASFYTEEEFFGDDEEVIEEDEYTEDTKLHGTPAVGFWPAY